MSEIKYTYSKEEIVLADEYKNILEKNAELAEKVANSVAETVKSKKTELEFEKAVAGFFEKDYINQVKITELKQAELKASEKALQILYESGKISKEQFETEAKRLIQLEKTNDSYREGLELSRNLVSVLGGKPGKDTYLGKLTSPVDFAKVGGAIKGIFNTANMARIAFDSLANAFEKFIKLSIDATMELDKANVELNRSTGLTNKFQNSLIGITQTMRKYGFAAADVGKAIGELAENNLLFTSYTEDSQDIMIKSNLILGKMGYNTGALVKQQVNLTKVMKKSPQEAIKFQMGMKKLQTQLGLTSSQMQGASEASQEAMSIIGDSTGKEFSRLTQVMQKTGLGMEKLISLSDKFNTFEGAADSVGKLNALMGGPYLNAVNMLEETDPSKRLSMISQNLKAAGVTWEGLGPQSRRAYAAALGLEKVTDLALLLSDRIDLIQGQDLSLGMSPEEIEKQAKELAQYNTLMEDLQAIGRSLAMTFIPVISGIKDALSEAMESQGFKDAMAGLAEASKNIDPSAIKDIVVGLANFATSVIQYLPMIAKGIKTMLENPILTGVAFMTIKGIGGIGGLLGGGGGTPGSSPSNPMYVSSVDGVGGSGGIGDILDALPGKKKKKGGSRASRRSSGGMRTSRSTPQVRTVRSSRGLVSSRAGRAAVSSATTRGATRAASSAVGRKVAATAGRKAATKAAGKIAAKGLGKSLLKKIPGVGAIVGLTSAYDRYKSGDLLGAFGEAASGIASIVPGVGTAISTAIDAGMMGRDIYSATKGGSASAPGSLAGTQPASSPSRSARSRISTAETSKRSSSAAMLAGSLAVPIAGLVASSFMSNNANAATGGGGTEPIKVVLNVDGNAFGEVIANIPFNQKFPRSTFVADIANASTRGANNL